MSEPDGGGDSTRSVFVQPRELSESAFRALYAAGADPAEAREGGLAVLQAEVESQNGLALLEQLLAADWAEPVQPAGTMSTRADSGTTHVLYFPEQPGLRSAIQLIEMAVSGSKGETHVVRSTVVGIPRQLWNSLLLRRTADLNRNIIAIFTGVTTDGRTAIEYLTVRNGSVTSATEPPSAALAALAPSSKGDTMLIVLPDTNEPAELASSIPREPLKVCKSQWERIYQLSRSYLTADQ